MQLVAVNWQVAVTDTATKVATITPGHLQSLIIQVATGSSPIVLGDEGHTIYGSGYPMIAGDTFTISWLDFDPQVRSGNQTFDIWAVCDTGLTATLQVYGWAKQ